MYRKKNGAGSTLIFAIAAIFVLSVLAVGIQKISSTSVVNELMFNQANQARNLAYSGLEYTKGLAYVYQNDSTKKFEDFKTDLEKEVNLGENVGSFIVSVSNDAAENNVTPYNVSVIGQTPSGPLQAKYQLPSPVGYIYTSKPISIQPPLFLFAANKINFSGNKYTGDNIFSEYAFNGGATIDGSLDYVNPPTAPGDPPAPPLSCLLLKLTSVGLGDGTSHVCSSSCVTIDSNTKVTGTVYSQSYIDLKGGSIIGDVHASSYMNVSGNSSVTGNVYAVGDVSVDSGKVTGDIHSGGNVTVGCGASGKGFVVGKIYAVGNISICNASVSGQYEKVNNPDSLTSIFAGGDVSITKDKGTISGDVNYGGSYLSASCANCIVKGSAKLITDPAKLPAKPSAASSCSSYSLPVTYSRENPLPDPTDKFSWYPQYLIEVIKGSADKTLEQVYTSITSNNSGFHICFDLSVPDSYVNLFVNGNFYTQGSILLKTTATGTCNAIDTYKMEDLKKYAKRIYVEVNGSTELTSDAHDWVGTILSNGNIKGSSTLDVVGALYSNGTIDTGGGSNSFFVMSDYAEENWK
uniref:Integral membrane protein CcmA involved in cell shape determination n=1 Tax=Desulfovibrio sp. U5L TaxID=596152 RepID=I2Q034_9BACT